MKAFRKYISLNVQPQSFYFSHANINTESVNVLYPISACTSCYFSDICYVLLPLFMVKVQGHHYYNILIIITSIILRMDCKGVLSEYTGIL
jgi:hypothetical protein